MEILLSEHKELVCCPFNIHHKYDSKKYESIIPFEFPSKKEKRKCYQIRVSEEALCLTADYFVGVDWLIEDEHFIQVKPKLNTILLQRFEDEINNNKTNESEIPIEEHPKDLDADSNYAELDYLKLLLDAFSHPAVSKYTDDLVFIDWDKKQIPITQKDDTLTPFLVVQFLNLLKQIARKGLKKSYYKVQENLNNRVKGKILIGTHIKKNVLKNRFTKICCEYQEFGIDHQENKFLKKVLMFCSNYVHQNSNILGQNKINLEQLINYSHPAFELVNDDITSSNLKNIKYNPFFKEYKEAIKIGSFILKRFSYNISNTATNKISTPPFWVDMTKLFELYVFRHLLTVFNEHEIKFQLATYGNILDFLIIKENSQMVIDAKYKMHYRSSHIHQDIRQVAGYARLSKVYKELKKPEDSTEMIDCLIIYPEVGDLPNTYQLEMGNRKTIEAYKKVFKLGIRLPYL